MKVLVTGGAGYIGAVLTRELLSEGCEVTVYDNFLYNEQSLFSLLREPKLNIYRGDVRDIERLRPHINEADVVIPLAALVGAPICERDIFSAQTVNHDSVVGLFDCLSQSQLVIMPTTNSAYGTTTGGSYCNELSPLKPISKYARDKVMTEEVLMQRQNSISLRLATVFGFSPRMRTDLLVNDFVLRAVTDKVLVIFESQYYRNYIHVYDVARAFVHCLRNMCEMNCNIYNVGLSSANLTKLELAHRIQKQLPDLNIVDSNKGSDPDQRNYLVSNEKIERAGFKPEIDLDSGIRELIKGYGFINHRKYTNI